MSIRNPFTGRELFGIYEFQMGRLHYDGTIDRGTIIDEAWEAIGKTKKQAWNNLAKLINSRMQQESSSTDTP